MGVGDRHGIVVGVESDQGQGIGPARFRPAGLQGIQWQLPHLQMILGQKLTFGPSLASQFSSQIVSTPLPQVPIEFIKIPDLRNGDKEVLAGEADDPLDHTLFIGPANQAEMVVEQIVAQQVFEGGRQVPLPAADDFAHTDSGVVVGDPPRRRPEELKRPHVALQERLRAFGGKSHDEEGVRVRQDHDKERNRS